MEMKLHVVDTKMLFSSAPKPKSIKSNPRDDTETVKLTFNASKYFVWSDETLWNDLREMVSFISCIQETRLLSKDDELKTKVKDRTNSWFLHSK